MFEYAGQPGHLTLRRPSPERLKMFRDLERDPRDEMSLSKLVSYIVKFRLTPPKAGMRSFNHVCRRMRNNDD